jgi:hypothetical protein
VREYIVWRVLDGAIDWFSESSVFPGLRLQVARMLAGDLADVLAEIR